MATGKITKRAVDALASDGGTVFLWDDELRGFGVRVTANGAKSYIYQYRLGGREAQKKRATIGRHGSPWTPATAREEAQRLALMAGKGIDPADHDRERRRQAVDLAFSAYVTAFTNDELKASWKDWQGPSRLLEREAVPVLKTKPLPQIKRSDVAAVLDRMADRPALARVAHATLRKLFKWAESRGDIERSPMEGMKAPAGVAARARVLTDDELRLVWHAAAGIGYPFGPMFRLLVVTGQRREEVAGLTWQELDRTNLCWNLPSQRSKNKIASVTPLNALATAELDALAILLDPPADGAAVAWPRKGLVFTTTGQTSSSGFSKAKSRLDAAIKDAQAKAAAKAGEKPEDLPEWRLHDLRRTVATGLQRLGVRFEVTEAVLNHVSGAKGGVAGVYQRHDWADEKRAALTAWADRLIAMVYPPPEGVG